jgi:hypothetical protein
MKNFPKNKTLIKAQNFLFGKTPYLTETITAHFFSREKRIVFFETIKHTFLVLTKVTHKL